MRRAILVLLIGLVLPSAVRGELRQSNNLVSELLEVKEIAGGEKTFAFQRERAGWVFVGADVRGTGTITITLDDDAQPVATKGDDPQRREGMRLVETGEHVLQVKCEGDARIDRLVVRAIPELMHCGLGYDPAIKSYGKYDLEFLKRDILPNVTTLIVPAGIKLEPGIIEGWHRRGKKFVGGVGINYQAKSAEEHFQYWTGFFERTPWLDGIIIDEFIINQPIREWMPVISPERQKKFDEERAQYPLYEEAFRKIRADQRYKGKMIYAYVGGSGKKLNQEIVGPTFVRSVLECGYRIGLERYIFEVSNEQKSKEVLKLFVEGVADWVAKEPRVREQMVVTFGLFSMPPGGINKQPNVDYHVWMDQQMNVVANDPALAGLGGLNWWTSLQADEETVRFVGKLYRHYAIEGKKELFTRDPLFLKHLQNADFERGLADWTFQNAEEGGIQAKSFPRYGRIQGRYMGLGRPADPEHIGDTFVVMKRSRKGANSVSQEVKDLEPGRLYSLKMFSCDYRDLVDPNKKTKEEVKPFVGEISLEGGEVDQTRSFREMYASSPEPPIPVWITYHWVVFRARGRTAKLTVSDWPKERNSATFGQEQTFNFLELEPYWD